MIEVTENGEEKLVKENRSYFGETAIITNERHLDLVLNTESIAEKVIVAVDMSNPMVFHEFESEVDAIVVGFGGSVSDEAFLEIITGQVEPSGLLPLQMPANMETVEAQLEDVPRDMEPHVDSNGNAYDFAFGLNWSGVINDNRTEKYNVPPIIGNSPN
jgi:beta-glucosidase